MIICCRLAQKLVKLPTSELLLTSGGFVRWVVHVSTETRCSLNVKLFPFDSHSCSIDFGVSTIRMSRDVAPVNLVYDEYVSVVQFYQQQLQVIYSSLFARSDSIARSENEITTVKKKRKKTHNNSDTSHELKRALKL